MSLSHAEVEEFRGIYRQETGVDLTHVEARTMANRLIRLYVLLLRPPDLDEN